MRDDGQVVVLVGVHTAEPLRPFDVFDLGDDADLGQFRRDYFAALARVGWWRQLEREFQRGLDAGLGQQGLGLLDVERVDAGGVHITKSARHIVAADGNAITVTGTFDHRLAVDRRQDGTAHTHVVERLLLVVDGQDGLGPGPADKHLEFGVVLELRHRARRYTREGIDVTGQQGRYLRRRVADKAERDLLQLDGGGIAVTAPFGQHDRRTLVPGFKLERSGADRFGAVGLGAFGLDDDGRALSHEEQELRVELRIQDDHRVVVDRRHAGHAGEGALVLVDTFLGGGALERKLDCAGVERLAVLEFDAPAQLEGIGLQVGRHFPALGQQGRDRPVAVDLGQGLEYVVERDLADRGCGASGRVEPGGRFERHCKDHRVLLRLGLCGEGYGRQRGGGGSRREDGAAIDHGQGSFQIRRGRPKVCVCARRNNITIAISLASALRTTAGRA